MREVVRAALELDDHTVLEAEDGEAALNVLAREPVDLAIVDMRMPRMDGETLILQLRHTGSRVKILATAGQGGEALDFAMEAGADRTLGKPFHLEELRAAVRELLGQEDSGEKCQ